MTQPTASAVTRWTMADLLDELGDIPPERIRLRPAPGAATEQDVLDIEIRENRLCELVDGVLVEKVMSYYESRVAVILIHLIQNFLDRHDLGIVTGADGMLKLKPRTVRIPDVAFVSWKKFPNHEIPAEPIPHLIPDLAVEVLSEGNTKKEMDRKLQDYFSNGVHLVWYIDPKTRTASAYTAADQMTSVGADGALDGGAVLPGFVLPLLELFTRAGRQSAQHS
jgi:Uma2 family endonuclease